jgi:hypothetical protein
VANAQGRERDRRIEGEREKEREIHREEVEGIKAGMERERAR